MSEKEPRAVVAEIYPDVALWAARIANALEPMKSLDMGWGHYWIEDVVLSFEGEPTNLRLRIVEGELVLVVTE
jgi:hypothetical protein